MIYNITGLAVYNRPLLSRIKEGFKRAFSLFLYSISSRLLYKGFFSYSLRVVKGFWLIQRPYLSSSEYLNRMAFLDMFYFQQSVREHNVKQIRGFSE